MTEEVKKIMSLLDCTEEEALQVIHDDQKVDKMTKTSEINEDLTTDQKAISKKYRQGDRKPVAYNWDTRERKADDDKGYLVKVIADALQGQAETLEVTNQERQIDFKFRGRKFRIVLSAPRK